MLNKELLLKRNESQPLSLNVHIYYYGETGSTLTISSENHIGSKLGVFTSGDFNVELPVNMPLYFRAPTAKYLVLDSSNLHLKQYPNINHDMNMQIYNILEYLTVEAPVIYLSSN